MDRRWFQTHRPRSTVLLADMLKPEVTWKVSAPTVRFTLCGSVLRNLRSHRSS